MAVMGPALCVGGALIADRAIQKDRTETSEENDKNLESGLVLLGMGIVSTAVSIPTIVSNSIRIKKVKNAMKDHSKVSLNIAPLLEYNDRTQNLQTSLTIRIRF